MTRIRKKNLLSRIFSFRAIYMLLSNYGEDPFRPLACLAILTFTSTLFWSVYWPIASMLWGLLKYTFFSSLVIAFLSIQGASDIHTIINVISTYEILVLEVLDNTSGTTENASKIIWSFERTLYNLVGFRQDDGKIADFVVTSASYPLLGLLFISLRRRFERRFRH
jgi:hypothetical protein